VELASLIENIVGDVGVIVGINLDAEASAVREGRVLYNACGCSCVAVVL